MASVRVWLRVAGAGAIGSVTAMAPASCSSNSHPGELATEDAGMVTHPDAAKEDTYVAPQHDATTGMPETGGDDGASDGAPTDAQPIDVVPACDGGLTYCSGACTNTNADPRNCGQCDNACPLTQSCVGGTCACQPDAGLSLCGNRCINTDSDPANCGACAHNCQGSTCANGLCVPTVVASPGLPMNSVIWDIAVDNTYMYWTQTAPSGVVRRKQFAGGNTEDLIGSLTDPRGVAIATTMGQFGHVVSVVDNSNALVSQVDTILGPSSLQQLWPPRNNDAGIVGPPAPLDVAVDDRAVYWVSYGTANNTGRVLSVPIGSDGTVTPTLIADAQNYPVAIAVDGANVYWVNTGNGTLDNGTVNQAPKAGGTTVPLAQNLATPWDLAVDATSVYWTERTNPGAVKKIPIGGGTVTTLAHGEGAPYGIAVDLQPPVGSMTAYVYWTDYDDNTVKRLPVGGGGMPFVLASGGDTNNPSAITVDNANVYWVSQGKSEILKVAQ